MCDWLVVGPDYQKQVQGTSVATWRRSPVRGVILDRWRRMASLRLLRSGPVILFGFEIPDVLFAISARPRIVVAAPGGATESHFRKNPLFLSISAKIASAVSATCTAENVDTVENVDIVQASNNSECSGYFDSKLGSGGSFNI